MGTQVSCHQVAGPDVEPDVRMGMQMVREAIVHVVRLGGDISIIEIEEDPDGLRDSTRCGAQ